MGFDAVAQGQAGAGVDGVGVVEGVAEFVDGGGVPWCGSRRMCRVLPSGMMSPEPAAEVDPYGHRPPTSAPGGDELSPYGITANTGTSLESAGVQVATMGGTAGLEDPNGQPPVDPGPVGLPLLPPPQPNP